MITSITQTAVATLIAAVKEDLSGQTITIVNLGMNLMPDGAANINLSVGIPASGTNPSANGTVSINYTIPAGA